MSKLSALSLILINLTLFLSCSPKYPDSFKIGTFKTTTDLNTVRYLYRNYDYQYEYSEVNQDGNKLSQITWNFSGYDLKIINKTSPFDSIFRTIVLEDYDENSITETSYAEGFDLKFTTKWIRIDENPNEKLGEALRKYGVKSK